MKKAILLFTLCLVLTAGCFVAVYADGYDSTTDPVITLSYVNNNLLPQIDSRINELEKLLEAGGGTTSSGGASSAELTALATRVTTLETKLASMSSSGKTPTAAGAEYAEEYTAIYVEYGKTILAPTTACEIILRSGTAQIVSPFADQGLSDMTGGRDLLGGTGVTLNHMLLIPRGGDGRGVRITSTEGAYLMVRGEYKIVNG